MYRDKSLDKNESGTVMIEGKNIASPNSTGYPWIADSLKDGGECVRLCDENKYVDLSKYACVDVCHDEQDKEKPY